MFLTRHDLIFTGPDSGKVCVINLEKAIKDEALYSNISSFYIRFFLKMVGEFE